MSAPSLQIAEDSAVLHHVPLSRVTTFQLGGPARELVTVATPEALRRSVHDVLSRGEPFVVIGGGSNIVCSDEGLPCRVIRYVSDRVEMAEENGAWCVAGSVGLDRIVERCVADGIGGLTFASGIPGTLGGAVAGNAGAFGAQIGDCVAQVELIDPATGGVRVCSREEMAFAYRYSRIRDRGGIISRGWMILPNGPPAHLRQEREALLALRREKHPDWRAQPCAGSVFRNLEASGPGARRMAAGKVLEESGAGALRVGGAAVFVKHANIIVKETDSCTAQDVIDLVWCMHNKAQEKMKISLTPEIRFLGRFRAVPGQAAWITGVGA